MSLLKIAVLNVGHGDFIYATTPLGNNLVIDCGSDNGDVTPSRFLGNIKSIDELQISHPHTDHFDEILNVGDKIIKSFRCVSLDKFDDKTIGWRKSDAAKIAKLRNMTTSIKANNDSVACDRNFFHYVYYPSNIDYTNPNTASLVTILSYAGFKMLFGGDLPDSGWKDLLKDQKFINAIRGINVFKVPHHGRKEGCSDDLFKHISPQLCIISDKPLDKSNENTVATNWYTSHSKGAKVIKSDGTVVERKVITTRNDGSVFIKVDENGKWTVFLNTSWRS